MDVQRLLRLKGAVDAAAGQQDSTDSRGLVESYQRLRNEVTSAVGDALADEFSRLFPAELSTSGRPWGWQAQEVRTLLTQMGGWIDQLVRVELPSQRAR
jgi:hypothetical protein